jgi:hypothetical protein
MCVGPAGNAEIKYTASAISWQHNDLCFLPFVIHVAICKDKQVRKCMHNIILVDSPIFDLQE